MEIFNTQFRQPKALQLFSQTEIHEMTRKREAFDLKLVQNNNQLKDYVAYVKYERSQLTLAEERQRTRQSDLQLDEVIARKIKHLLSLAVLRYPDRERLWDEYISSSVRLRAEYNELRGLYNKMRHFNADKPSCWLKAIRWERQNNNKRTRLEEVYGMLAEGMRRHPSCTEMLIERLNIVLTDSRFASEVRLQQALFAYSLCRKSIDTFDFQMSVLAEAQRHEFADKLQLKVLEDMREKHFLEPRYYHLLAQRELQGLVCYVAESESATDELETVPENGAQSDVPVEAALAAVAAMGMNEPPAAMHVDAAAPGEEPSAMEVAHAEEPSAMQEAHAVEPSAEEPSAMEEAHAEGPSAEGQSVKDVESAMDVDATTSAAALEKEPSGNKSPAEKRTAMESSAKEPPVKATPSKGPPAKKPPAKKPGSAKKTRKTSAKKSPAKVSPAKEQPARTQRATEQPAMEPPEMAGTTSPSEERIAMRTTSTSPFKKETAKKSRSTKPIKPVVSPKFFTNRRKDTPVSSSSTQTMESFLSPLGVLDTATDAAPSVSSSTAQVMPPSSSPSSSLSSSPSPSPSSSSSSSPSSSSSSQANSGPPPSPSTSSQANSEPPPPPTPSPPSQANADPQPPPTVASDASDREERVRSSVVRGQIERCVLIYEAAVSRLNNPEMWSYYLSSMVILNQDIAADNQWLMRRRLLARAFRRADAANHMTVDYYVRYVTVMRELHAPDADIEIMLLRALRRFNSSPAIWRAYMQHQLCVGDAKRVRDVFDESRVRLASKSMPLWKLYKQSLSVDPTPQNNDILESLYKEAVLQKCSDFFPMQVEYLDWVMRRPQASIADARTAFRDVAINSQPTFEMISKIVEMESLQVIPDHTEWRSGLLSNTQFYGDSEPSVWLNLLKFERDHGNPLNIGDICNVAKDRLRSDLVPTFIKERDFLLQQMVVN